MSAFDDPDMYARMRRHLTERLAAFQAKFVEPLTRDRYNEIRGRVLETKALIEYLDESVKKRNATVGESEDGDEETGGTQPRPATNRVKRPAVRIAGVHTAIGRRTQKAK